MLVSKLLQKCIIVFLFFYIIVIEGKAEMQIDKKGYVIYCPCMGRFGNQADHFLGSISFAKRIDRALVLPNWRGTKGHVSFDKWFQLPVIERYHKVITSEQFLSSVAPKIWPAERRIGFCYKSPHSKEQNECKMKEGSPFGPYWDHLGVDFTSTQFYNITYDRIEREWWQSYYPPSKYPVLAFRGAPAAFPVSKDDSDIHKYLWWTDEMAKQAVEHIYKHVGDSSYIAIHLRNGYDWENACKLAVGIKKFMSSPNCIREDDSQVITKSMCLPTKHQIVRKLRSVVEVTGIRVVYILTDQFPYSREITVSLSDLNVRVIFDEPDIPQLDLILAARANVFIGNCVSSFSSFINRERNFVTRKPQNSTIFFGMDSSDQE